MDAAILFFWGALFGSALVGALWAWHHESMRRRLRAAEWKAEGLRRCAVELHGMIKGCASRAAMTFLEGMMREEPK